MIKLNITNSSGQYLSVGTPLLDIGSRYVKVSEEDLRTGAKESRRVFSKNNQRLFLDHLYLQENLLEKVKEAARDAASRWDKTE